MYNLQNIKTVAAKKNMSIKELITHIKSTEQGFYKSLEKNSMNIKTLNEIAEVLGVTISELINDIPAGKKSKDYKIDKVSSPVELYDPPKDLAQCYKIMFEQQKEITDLTREVERQKNGRAPMNGAHAG